MDAAHEAEFLRRLSLERLEAELLRRGLVVVSSAVYHEWQRMKNVLLQEQKGANMR